MYEDIKDIRPDLAVPIDWLLVGIILAGVLLVALLGWLLIRFVIKRQHTKALAVVVIPAWQQALNDLEVLRKSDYIKNSQFKEYTFELTRIMRIYIEQRFAISAVEMTTEEFLISDQVNQCLSVTDRQILNDLLQQADLIKFAKEAPSAGFLESSMAQVIDFIQRTKEQHV
jgi:hypothetical protein